MNNNMRCVDLIVKKRDGDPLSKEEIQYFVEGVTKGDIQDVQIGAMLMALRLNGMSSEETECLTKSMMVSGETMYWPSSWKSLVVDKHSTGGVGDKVSLALTPALAACGMKVPMISGRGLGYTGGTLDKLESIPGLSVSHSTPKIKELLENVGCCIVGQTGKIVPADKILYAARDVTGTVDNDSLVAASIISKKAAEALDGLILDVKFGSGAIFQNKGDAKSLANIMVKTCAGLGIRTTALLTRMDAPLGDAVGNALEVAEIIDILHGRGPEQLVRLICETGGNLLYSVGKVGSVQEGTNQMRTTLNNGAAMSKFLQMVKGQGADANLADRLCTKGQDVFEILPKAQHRTELRCTKTGYVHKLDAMTCAKFCHKMGSGRSKAGDQINMAVGIQLQVQLGQHIKKGESWITIHHDQALKDDVITNLQAALEVKDESVPLENIQLISETITSY